MNIGWLLFTKSVKQGWKRLALIAGAVGVGVMILLTFAAALNGLNARDTHNAWRSQLFNPTAPRDQTPIEGVAPLLASTWNIGNLNKWQNETIWTTSVYATGQNSPKLWGVPMPQPGEYYVSPALDVIMRNNPDAKLGERFGTKYAGVLPAAHVTSPDSLDVVRGMTESEANSPENYAFSRIYSLPQNQKPVSGYGEIATYALFLGIVILLFPVVLFISIAVQLGSAQREQRYAALRLVGATRMQIRNIMAIESLIAALGGIVLGSMAFIPARLWLEQFRFDGMRFWPADLIVEPLQYAIIISLTLIMALVANWWGMRHVETSPLGVVFRSRTQKQPTWLRVLPLLVGVGIFFGAYLLTPKDKASTGIILLLICSVVLIMFGLVLSGSWLTRVFADIAARSARRVQVILGTKRIAAHPKQIFRSVSGVVVALFAGSFYLTAVSDMGTYNLRVVTDNGFSTIDENKALIIASTLPADFETTLRDQPYVTSIAPIQQMGDSISVVPCTILSEYTSRTCPDTQNVFAAITMDAPPSQPAAYGATPIQAIERAGYDLGEQGVKLDTNYFVNLTSNDHIEHLRSLVAANTHGLMSDGIYVVSGTYAKKPIITPIISELSSLTYVGIVVTMLIAIGSLTVSTIGGLLERKRSLATLRMSGMTVFQLKIMVIIESLIPLVVTAILSAGLGVWVGYMFMRLVSVSLDAIVSPLYIVVVLGSLAASTLAIYLILPIIEHLTNLESNRTE